MSSSSLSTFFLLLLLVSLSAASPRRDLLAYTGRKNPPTLTPEDGACREPRSRAACLGKSKRCRWCRSEALDDMCFGISEARRLPSQVFSCDI